MKKFGIIVLVFVLIAGGLFWGGRVGEMLKQKGVPSLPVTSQNADTANQQETAPAIPQSLRIPKIGVDTTVEQVGLDAQGRMDVPKNVDNVAWYSLGYKPGEMGNAVMAAHYDTVTGEPSVFWSINSLVPGDRIIVQDVNGNDHTFAVTQIQSYPYDAVPLQEVFGPASKPMLNLITCQGTWDSATHNYSERVVVYAQMQ